MLFYGQEHYDTMAILDDKRDYDADMIGEMIKNQKVLKNRQLMLKNFDKLIENLTDCENYISSVMEGKQQNNQEIGQMINECMS